MATKSTKNMIRDWVAKMIETTPPLLFATTRTNLKS